MKKTEIWALVVILLTVGAMWAILSPGNDLDRLLRFLAEFASRYPAAALLMVADVFAAVAFSASLKE